jgi:hypothetical protein
MVRRETAPEIGIRQKEPVPGQKKALRDHSSKRLSITNRIEKVLHMKKYYQRIYANENVCKGVRYNDNAKWSKTERERGHYG